MYIYIHDMYYVYIYIYVHIYGILWMVVRMSSIHRREWLGNGSGMVREWLGNDKGSVRE